LQKISSDFLEAIEAIEMIATPKHKHQEVNNRGNREYWRREKALDEALKDTFPASDPVSVEQPGPPAMLEAKKLVSERQSKKSQTD
jgi:hypothetical protein